jgi:integrase/recombinase XerD
LLVTGRKNRLQWLTMPRKTELVKDTCPADLEPLIGSWVLAMTAERKSPDTIRTYEAGARTYFRWCAQEGQQADLSRASVAAFTAAVLAKRAPATALSRQRGCRRFSAWLAAEGEISADELTGLKPPQMDEVAVQPLTPAQLKALLDTCRGKEFHHVRDAAVIRLLAETGARASEVTGMEKDDVTLAAGLAVIRRGKGGKGRVVPFGPQAGAALDRYLRARRRHPLALTPALWLGDRGRAFGYDGLYSSITRRGKLIGLDDLHPHQLRNTMAVRWLRKGGSPAGLMAVAGWSSIDMLRRYVRAAESDLAAEESRRLDLGDF